MKIYKAMIEVTILFAILVASIYSVIYAFTYSTLIGWTVLGGTYFFNALTTLNTFIFNKRSDALIKSSWMFLLLLFPFVGGLLNLKLSYQWTWNKKAHEKSDLLKSEVFGNNKITTNGKIKIIGSGDKKFETIFAELEKAEYFINIQSFIINGGIIYKRLEDILIRKAKAGVKIRISTDYVGSLQTANSTYKKLRDAGIEFSIFNKVNVLLTTGRSNNRNHDKIIVIDNKVAFTGGTNIGDDYSHLYKKYGLWCDLNFLLEGDIVRDYNRKFILDWYETTRQKLKFEKRNSEEGNIELLFDFPWHEDKAFMNKLVEQIDEAKTSIKLISPYLVVPNRLFDALINASSRGVVVNIITTGKADKRMAYFAATGYAHKLSTYGVKIMRTNNFFMHAKAYIIDDEISFIGTSNLDYRALFQHYETNMMIKDKKLNSDLTDYFNELAQKTYLEDKKSQDWNVFEVLKWWVIKLMSPFL